MQASTAKEAKAEEVAELVLANAVRSVVVVFQVVTAVTLIFGIQVEVVVITAAVRLIMMLVAEDRHIARQA